MTKRQKDKKIERRKDRKIKIRKDKNMKRQKDEKTEMFERLNCNDIKISLNKILTPYIFQYERQKDKRQKDLT